MNITNKPPFRLLPLSPEKQKQLITKFLKASTKQKLKTESECTELAISLIDCFKKSIGEKSGNDFLKIPLHCWMLAEMYNNGILSNAEPIQLCDFFSKFCTMKIDIYLTNKCQLKKELKCYAETVPKRIEKMTKAYQKHALKQLFASKTRLWEKISNKECEEAWGLTVGEDQTFIHRSFMEYYASLYVAENLENQEIFDLLVELVFISSRYQNVRKFLNRLIVVKYCDDKVLVQDQNDSTEIPFSNTVEAIRNASIEGNEGIFKFIFDRLGKLEKFRWKILSARDNNGDTAFHLASMNGHEKIVESILQFATENEINWEKLFEGNKDKNTPLHLASRDGQEKVVKKMLFSGNEKVMETILFSGNQNLNTPLHLTSREGHERVVQLILKFAIKVKVNVLLTRNKNGDTPLHWASMRGHVKVVQLILNSEIKGKKNILFTRNKSGDTPLHWASMRGHDKVVQLILDFATNNNIGPEILFVENKANCTPIQIASKNGHNAVAESLNSWGVPSENSNVQ